MAFRKIGAGWNTEKGGISLSVDEALENRAYLFPNKYKKTDKHPDWVIMVPEDDLQEEKPLSDIPEDDIPF